MIDLGSPAGGGVRVLTNDLSSLCVLLYSLSGPHGASSDKRVPHLSRYVPADADPTKTAPIKYKMAATDQGHLSTGCGSLE
jgi:hypothetical protein